MRYDEDVPFARRAASIGGVALIHGFLVALLLAPGVRQAAPPALIAARMILDRPRSPPPAPPLPTPALAAPPPMLPMPDILVAATPARAPAAPRAVARNTPQTATPAAHFGAAADTGLGLDVAVSASGGAGSRGTLAAFEATVRRQVLAGKRQPVLAWDRRNTCVVAYHVTVTRSGGLAGFSIEPCAIPEINQAARDAIGRAGPFPPPPDLGAPAYEVHGSLVFHP